MFAVGPTFFSSSGYVSDGLTKLQVDYIGSTDDKSIYALGAGSTTGGGGTLGSGVYSVAFTSTTTKYIQWLDAEIEVFSNSAYTNEFFFKCVEVTSNPPSSTQIAQINFGSFDMLVQINGHSGGVNTLTISKIGGGFSYTTTGVDYFDGAVHHIATVLRTSGTLDVYLDGTRVVTGEAYSRKSPALGYGYTLHGFSGTTGQSVTIEHYGVRVREEEVYSGSSFTPPTSPADWGTP